VSATPVRDAGADLVIIPYNCTIQVNHSYSVDDLAGTLIVNFHGDNSCTPSVIQTAQASLTNATPYFPTAPTFKSGSTCTRVIAAAGCSSDGSYNNPAFNQPGSGWRAVVYEMSLNAGPDAHWESAGDPTAQEYCTGFGTQIITCDFPDIFQMGR